MRRQIAAACLLSTALWFTAGCTSPEGPATEPPTADTTGAPAVSSPVEEEPVAEDPASAETEPLTEDAAPPVPIEPAPEETMPVEEPAAATPEPAETPAEPEMPAPAPEESTPEEPAAEPTPEAEPADESEPAPEPASVETETVKLGDDPSLTAGIPGEGPLSLEEIKAWLDDPANHVVLIPELPLGLHVGQAQIQGLDENPLTRAKIELGRQLYFDPRLSMDHSVSCASCHHPEEGFARETVFGVGIGGAEGDRNSPTSFNRILSSTQFWDGRAATLEEQAIGPIANPIEMGNTHDVCVQTIKDIPGYEVQFAAIFGDVTIENVAQAIASFERTIVTGPSPYDYNEELRKFEELGLEPEELEEEEPELFAQYQELLALAAEHPMSDSAKRGRDIFFSEKGNCSACHVGANLTDEMFYNLGVGMDADDPDLGRYVITGVEADRGAFKTPTIRNITQTAPYMHDGSQDTLMEVVEWYAKGGHPNPWLSDRVKKLDLSQQDKEDLVAFMEACTGPLPAVEVGRLPELQGAGE